MADPILLIAASCGMAAAAGGQLVLVGLRGRPPRLDDALGRGVFLADPGQRGLVPKKIVATVAGAPVAPRRKRGRARQLADPDLMQETRHRRAAKAPRLGPFIRREPRQRQKRLWPRPLRRLPAQLGHHVPLGPRQPQPRGMQAPRQPGQRRRTQRLGRIARGPGHKRGHQRQRLVRPIRADQRVEPVQFRVIPRLVPVLCHSATIKINGQCMPINSQVTVDDLLHGIIIQSGNDASIAIADYVAGSQDAFVSLMNGYAKKMGLTNTTFMTVHGLDAPGQHSSAYDLAVLSRAIIHGEPDFYHMYSEKSLTWNGITQQNRNGLLWDKTMNVDGLKTGHTSGAGFNLIASAVDGQRRLIAVVMGAESAKGREDQARKLLQWGQKNFDTVQVLRSGKQVGIERIWYGDKENIVLGTVQEFWMVLPKAEIPHIKAKYTLDGKELTAPISAHQRVGEIELYDRDKQVAHWPLVTLESVGEGSMFSRLSDYFHHKA